MDEIVYKDLPHDAVAVYLGKRRIGTIVRLGPDRWQYCADSRAALKGEVMRSLASVKKSLESD